MSTFREQLQAKSKENSFNKELLDIVLKEVEREAEKGSYMAMVFVYDDGEFTEYDIEQVAQTLQNRPYDLNCAYMQGEEFSDYKWRITVDWMD